MDPVQEEKLRRIFQHFDADKSGTIETKELRSILDKMGIKLDLDNTTVLVKRYDADNSGQLDFKEFSEMLMLVINMKKQFELADNDKSGTISAKEMTTVVEHLHLKVSPQSILPVIKLFDEDGNGTVDYQEFFALVFYFQELEYQYENYVDNEGADYKWLPQLLGPVNTGMANGVASKLAQLLRASPNGEPSFDEFVRIVVEAAIQGNTDPTGRRRKGAPRITTVRDRNRVRAPRRNIKMRGQQPGQDIDKISSKMSSLVINPKDLYCDPSFALGPGILPPQAKNRIFHWKRPYELNNEARLFVDGVEEGDVIQGGLGDCWFLGALAVLATSTEGFIPHLFVKAQPERGYYQVKFHKNGEWRYVEVDDRLPCGHSEKLYFATCRDSAEFWVPIVEKAYAKLHGSYEALELGNITDGLKDLTGEAVEVMMLDDPSFQKQPKALWDTLVHNIKESYLMGCSLEDSSAQPEAANAYGLLVNHAYSVIDCQEVQGKRLMRIRNPWGRGEWTGPWGDGTKEWTPQLLKHFDYEFGNDGTFFMEFNDFIKHFNRVYVLRLMTDDQGEVWEKSSFLGEWKGPSAGGCTNTPAWSGNPQYGLVVDQHGGDMKVFVNLAQPDLRYETRLSPPQFQAKGKDYEPIGIIVMKTNDVRYKKTAYVPSDRVATSLFCGFRDLSYEVTLPPGQYVVIPCTYAAGVNMKYELQVYTQRKCHIQPISSSALPPSKSCRSSWSGKTAGGCANHRGTWMNNPQFVMTVDKPGSVSLSVEQLLSPNMKPECIGIYVFRANPGGAKRLDQPSQIVLMPQTFLNLPSVVENFRAEPNVQYIVMPTTFNPLERNFNISASSTETTVTSLSPL